MLYAEIFEKKKVLGKATYIFMGLVIVYCGVLQIRETDYAPETAEVCEGYNEIVFDTIVGASEYRIPLLYYKGYEAVLLDEKGKSHEMQIHTGEEYSGVFWVMVPENLKGQIIVSYEGTILQKLSMIVSIITLLVVLGCSICTNVKNMRCH